MWPFRLPVTFPLIENKLQHLFVRIRSIKWKSRGAGAPDTVKRKSLDFAPNYINNFFFQFVVRHRLGPALPPDETFLGVYAKNPPNSLLNHPFNWLPHVLTLRSTCSSMFMNERLQQLKLAERRHFARAEGRGGGPSRSRQHRYQ